MRPGLHHNIDAEISRLGIYGEGIASLNGFTVFISGALPGEKVRAKMTLVRKNYGKARLEKVLIPSPLRKDPPCPVFFQCGGCQLMHLPYPEQLQYKTDKVAGDLSHIGGIAGVTIIPCLASERQTGYRNKIELPFGSVKGKPAFGFYAPESHIIVPFDRCLVHCNIGDQALKGVRRLVFESGIPPYNEITHHPGIRHLIIRTSEATQEILVVLVTNGFAVKGIENLAQKIMTVHPAIKGVVQNNNPRQGNAILGKSQKTLAGKDNISDKVLGLTFRIDALSFFQVNTTQTMKLLRTVEALAKLTGKETLLDLFCGVGLFSLHLGKNAAKVIGIEEVEESVSLAKFNAELNNSQNVEFLCADAVTAIRDIRTADVVVLDPPRKGCESGLLESVAKLAPERIVYVSCNPATLARDLKQLVESGYGVETVQPVDMFPQTAHVETVVALKRVFR